MARRPHLQKRRFKKPSIYSPLKACGTFLLYFYLLCSAIYEGGSEDLNNRKEYVKHCSCKDGDRKFYLAWFIAVTVIWILCCVCALIKYCSEKKPCQR